MLQLHSEHMPAITTPMHMHRSVTGNTMPPSGTEEVQKKIVFDLHAIVNRSNRSSTSKYYISGGFFCIGKHRAVWPGRSRSPLGFGRISRSISGIKPTKGDDLGARPCRSCQQPRSIISSIRQSLALVPAREGIMAGEMAFRLSCAPADA